MPREELVAEVMRRVVGFEDTDHPVDEGAVQRVAEYFELCDYEEADIAAVEDQSEASSECYLLYYMLKLLNEEGWIVFTDPRQKRQ